MHYGFLSKSKWAECTRRPGTIHLMNLEGVRWVYACERWWSSNVKSARKSRWARKSEWILRSAIHRSPVYVLKWQGIPKKYTLTKNYTYIYSIFTSSPSSLTCPLASPAQTGTSNSTVLHSSVSRQTKASVPVLANEGNKTIRVWSFSSAGQLSAASTASASSPPTRAVSNSGWLPMIYTWGRWWMMKGSASGNGYIPADQLFRHPTLVDKLT